MDENADTQGPSGQGESEKQEAQDQATDAPPSTASYWRANIKLLSILMTFWFLISFGGGILFRPFLDQFSLGGYPLGFWFAQQGSIYGFIILIVIYVRRMRTLDRKYGLED